MVWFMGVAAPEEAAEEKAGMHGADAQVVGATGGNVSGRLRDSGRGC